MVSQDRAGETAIKPEQIKNKFQGDSIMAQEFQMQFVEEVKRNSGLAIAMGVVVLLMGLLAMGSPLVAGISVAMVVGIVLLIGGVGQLIFAVKAGKGFSAIILGVLTVIAGIYMVSNPGAALATLTLVLAIYLIVSGVFEALMAFQIKPTKGWGLTLFSGVISAILGIMIWGQFPVSGTWAIGILLGVRLVFSGWTLITLGLMGRSAAKGAASAA